MKILVGVYVLQDNKLLMVQEAEEPFCGLWNIPSGKLEEHESIFEAAIRETKEETGFDIKLTGFLGIQNSPRTSFRNLGEHLIRITFTAEIIGGDVSFDPKEIRAVEFIDVEKVLAMDETAIKGIERVYQLEKLLKGKILPLDSISEIFNVQKSD